ncbi:MAG: hypothetical protein IJ555_12650 [Ruminococcus sp.]|nr:hypothetical protein [Ruminococcus sp.]
MKKATVLLISALTAISMTACSDTVDQFITQVEEVSNSTTSLSSVQKDWTPFVRTPVTKYQSGSQYLTTKRSTTTGKTVTTSPKTTTYGSSATDTTKKNSRSSKSTFSFSDDNSSSSYSSYSSSGKTDGTKYVENIPANKGVKYVKNTHGIFNPSAFDAWIFYDFASHGEVGCGAYKAESENVFSPWKNTDNVSYTEMYMGITADITDNRYLNVKAYEHADNVSLSSIELTYEQSSRDLDSTFSKSKESLSADLRDDCYINGMYAITATFKSSKGTSYKCNLYLCVNCESDKEEDMESYICCADTVSSSNSSTPYKRAKLISELLEKEGVTPESALKAKYVYPYSYGGNDTQYWIDKSYELLKNCSGCSDRFKLFKFHEWITKNLKYDSYKANIRKVSRFYNGNAIDPTQYVSANYTGICLDFSSIYAIMCREQGIPCVVINSKSHAWNAVYVDGKWYEIDLTRDVNRFVYGVDTNEVSGDRLYCYDGFFKPFVGSQTPLEAAQYCYG